MILVRLFIRVWQVVATPAAARLPGPRALPAYAALARAGTAAATLDLRLRSLVRQLAAELSGCRWCIEHGRHLWRQAFLSPDELGALRRYPASSLFSERERAALAFTEAVSRYRDAAGGIPDAVLAELRRHFTEPEVIALTLAVTGEHFFNAATGALGADAGSVVGPARRVAGSAIRNFW